jgi:uncharacterized Ntn-hydrolase superfamily protein
MPLRRGTYSIVAADPARGEVGVAVQSRYFCVGGVVPWAKAGVGAVATQAAGVAALGRDALAAIEAGAAPADALEQVLAGDAGRETRQLGAVTADGRAAAHTGADCLDWAGHLVGEGFAAQGNILAGERVVAEMARAFGETAGPLAERLMAALEAAEAAGGDRRGQQSAALVVERSGAAAQRTERIDRVVDLRVDDHAQPIEELRRLLGIRTTWDSMAEAHTRYEARDYAAASALMDEVLARGATDPVLLYNAACYDALAGRREVALERLAAACRADGSYATLAREDADLVPLRDDPRFAEIVGGASRPE